MIIPVHAQSWLGQNLTPALMGLCGLSTAVAGVFRRQNGSQPPVSHAGKGVTDTVLAAIDLEKRASKYQGRAASFPQVGTFAL